jgi:hypothetical protein
MGNTTNHHAPYTYVTPFALPVMLHILPDKFTVRPGHLPIIISISQTTHIHFPRLPLIRSQRYQERVKILHRGLMPQSLSQTLIDLFHHANAGGMFIPAPHMAGHRTYIRIFKYIYKNRTGLLNPFTGKEDRYKTLTLYRFYKISIILSFHHKTHMVPSLFLQMPLGRLFFFDAIFKSTLIA